jgi:hypothetical protein
MNRAPQLAIIVSAGVLLFVAAQWPQYTIPGCIAMFVVIGLALARMRPAAAAAGAPAKRNNLRRIAGIAIAAALLLWALLSLNRP